MIVFFESCLVDTYSGLVFSMDVISICLTVKKFKTAMKYPVNAGEMGMMRGFL
jgi:hypothetical protein